jgi:hypothetical protein
MKTDFSESAFRSKVFKIPRALRSGEATVAFVAANEDFLKKIVFSYFNCIFTGNLYFLIIFIIQNG